MGSIGSASGFGWGLAAESCRGGREEGAVVCERGLAALVGAVGSERRSRDGSRRS